MFKYIAIATALLLSGCALNFEDQSQTVTEVISSDSVKSFSMVNDGIFSSDISIYGQAESDSIRATVQVNQLVLDNEKISSVKLTFKDSGEHGKTVNYESNSDNWEGISIEKFRADLTDSLELSVKSTSGDLSVHNMKGPVWAKITSGDTKISSEGYCKVESTSGDVKVSTINGTTIQATSGDVYVRIEEKSDEFTGIYVKVTSGETEIYIPRGLAAWLDLKATSGDIFIPGNKFDNAYNGGLNGGTASSPIIKIKSTSGDIDIIEF